MLSRLQLNVEGKLFEASWVTSRGRARGRGIVTTAGPNGRTGTTCSVQIIQTANTPSATSVSPNTSTWIPSVSLTLCGSVPCAEPRAIASSVGSSPTKMPPSLREVIKSGRWEEGGEGGRRDSGEETGARKVRWWRRRPRARKGRVQTPTADPFTSPHPSARRRKPPPPKIILIRKHVTLWRNSAKLGTKKILEIVWKKKKRESEATDYLRKSLLRCHNLTSLHKFTHKFFRAQLAANHQCNTFRTNIHTWCRKCHRFSRCRSRTLRCSLGRCTRPFPTLCSAPSSTPSTCFPPEVPTPSIPLNMGGEIWECGVNNGTVYLTNI